MFDTLVYIPAILAYTFISLLVVILGFIVIYVTHKIYTSIYDNLPVAQLSSSKSTLSKQLKTLAQPSSVLALGGGKSDGRKSKTALRIIVTLEPCYLAYMVFESKTLSASSRQTKQQQRKTDSQVAFDDNLHLIKYFDSLSQLPTLRELKKCYMIKRNRNNNNNLRLIK